MGIENEQKALIDNWSLELAGLLLDGQTEHLEISDSAFISALGGLSNYINSLLLYDSTSYLANGFESDWARFGWFERNTRVFVNPIKVDSLNIDWNSELSYSDQGLRNYLVSANNFGTDLFISPERAGQVVSSLERRGAFNELLGSVDNIIESKANASMFSNVRLGVDSNFALPTLVQFALAQASTADDLLTVIMQLKSENRIKALRDKIDQIANDQKMGGKLQTYVEEAINESFGLKGNKEQNWSLQLSVLFLSISKSFHLDFFQRDRNILFLKDIIKCRTEAYKMKNDVERVFRRKLIM